VELLSTSSLLEVHLVSFHHLLSPSLLLFLLQLFHHLFWIVLSVQTCSLYCWSGSFLVRLTVIDSLSLLSLLLELLSPALFVVVNTTICSWPQLSHSASSYDPWLIIPRWFVLCLNLLSAVPCQIIVCSNFVDHFLPLCLCLHMVAAPSGSLQPEHQHFLCVQ